jgi:hypothetical protein
VSRWRQPRAVKNAQHQQSAELVAYERQLAAPMGKVTELDNVRSHFRHFKFQSIQHLREVVAARRMSARRQGSVDRLG